MKSWASVTMVAILLAAIISGQEKKDGNSPEAICQSNQNQMIKGMIMYANDNEDVLPHTTWGGICNKDWGALPEDGGLTWPLMLDPYVKSTEIWFCPSDPAEKVAEARAYDPVKNAPLPKDATPKQIRLAKSYHSNIGYNHLWLAPEATLGGHIVQKCATQSGVAAPASTILYVDSAWSRDEDGKPTGSGRYLIDAPVRFHTGLFWGPLPSKHESNGGWLCYSLGGGDPASAYCKTNPQAYGYCYPFHNGKFTVSFLDGHVKGLTAPQLVAGIDFVEMKVKDLTACLWDTGGKDEPDP